MYQCTQWVKLQLTLDNIFLNGNCTWFQHKMLFFTFVSNVHHSLRKSTNLVIIIKVTFWGYVKFFKFFMIKV